MHLVNVAIQMFADRGGKLRCRLDWLSADVKALIVIKGDLDARLSRVFRVYRQAKRLLFSTRP